MWIIAGFRIFLECMLPLHDAFGLEHWPRFCRPWVQALVSVVPSSGRYLKRRSLGAQPSILIRGQNVPLARLKPNKMPPEESPFPNSGYQCETDQQGIVYSLGVGILTPTSFPFRPLPSQPAADLLASNEDRSDLAGLDEACVHQPLTSLSVIAHRLSPACLLVESFIGFQTFPSLRAILVFCWLLVSISRLFLC